MALSLSIVTLILWYNLGHLQASHFLSESWLSLSALQVPDAIKSQYECPPTLLPPAGLRDGELICPSVPEASRQHSHPHQHLTSDADQDEVRLVHYGPVVVRLNSAHYTSKEFSLVFVLCPKRKFHSYCTYSLTYEIPQIRCYPHYR